MKLNFKFSHDKIEMKGKYYTESQSLLRDTLFCLNFCATSPCLIYNIFTQFIMKPDPQEQYCDVKPTWWIAHLIHIKSFLIWVRKYSLQEKVRKHAILNMRYKHFKVYQKKDSNWILIYNSHDKTIKFSYIDCIKFVWKLLHQTKHNFLLL